MKYHEIKKYIDEMYLVTQDKVQLSVISNINIQPYLDLFLKQIFIKNKLLVNILFLTLDDIENNKSIDVMSNSQMVIIWINFAISFPDSSVMICDEDVEQVVSLEILKCNQILTFIKKHVMGEILFICYEDYYMPEQFVLGNCTSYNYIVNRLNNRILENRQNQIIYIDLKKIIANIGVKNAYDFKNKYRWNCPYSKQLLFAVGKEIYKQYLIVNGISKKCIVLDCDNVLWKGILEEDGFTKIKLSDFGIGRAYKDFQRYLLFMYQHGVILTICSKNNLSNVLQVFNHHSEMVLKEKYISCFRVNWKSKIDNIKQIAQELNINLNSMVFIDDMPHEIEAVSKFLPDVKTIKFDIKNIYEQMKCFNLGATKNSLDIINRHETYKTNILRQKLRSEFFDIDSYIENLEQVITIKEANSMEYSRIIEITQRTNKFTNGKRYTLSGLKEKIRHDKYKVFTVHVSDRFSDLGLVGVIGIDEEKLDLFCLSCRALGRMVENKMIDQIVKYNVKYYFFKTTKRNDQVYELLKKTFLPL